MKMTEWLNHVNEIVVDADGNPTNTQMTLKWWLTDNSDGDNPDCRRLKRAFAIWRNLNWLFVWFAWCNIGTTIGRMTWVGIITHVTYHPWGMAWKLVGLAIALVFANVVANMSDKDDQRTAVPAVVLGMAAILSFLLKGSLFQMILSIITIISIIWEKVKTDGNRGKLHRTAPTAKVKRVTLPNGQEITITETEEKDKPRPPRRWKQNTCEIISNK